MRSRARPSTACATSAWPRCSRCANRTLDHGDPDQVNARRGRPPHRSDLSRLLEEEPYEFDRRFLFRVLSMGHSQFAEAIGARGPNTQVNSACASTTQAVATRHRQGTHATHLARHDAQSTPVESTQVMRTRRSPSHRKRGSPDLLAQLERPRMVRFDAVRVPFEVRFEPGLDRGDCGASRDPRRRCRWAGAPSLHACRAPGA